MLKRKPRQPQPPGASESQWAAMQKCVARMGLARDPKPEADDPLEVDRRDLLAKIDRLNTSSLSEKVKVTRFSGVLGETLWPIEAGPDNRFGYVTWLDAVEAMLKRATG